MARNTVRKTFVFILSWERPIYLWACLDSLFRTTKYPCNFVIADNASTNPLTHEVIDGFERRGMFHAVHREKDNHPRRLEWLINKYWDEIGDYFVIVEADITIVPRKPCWLQTFASHLDADPIIGAIGSRVYQPDFVSMEEARRVQPDAKDDDLSFLIKDKAPMRKYRHTEKEIIEPHNPPLRLLALRKTAYEEVGFGRDIEIHRNLVARGWRSVISTRVVHRHLSLLNIYDYPAYNRKERDSFFDKGMNRAAHGRAIFILGMHRSGTSCLAGALQSAGLHLGDVIEQSPYNKKGNRENKQVMQLNESVLKNSGGSWFRPPQAISWTDEQKLHRDAILASFRGQKVWGLKDPRLLLLIKFWTRAVSNHEFVGTFRHPAQVIQSLRSRRGPTSKEEETKLLLLWTSYNKRLLWLWKFKPFPLINFSAKPERYNLELEAICKHFGLKTQDSSEPFYDPTLQTSQGELVKLHGAAKNTYTELLECWESPENPIATIPKSIIPITFDHSPKPLARTQLY